MTNKALILRHLKEHGSITPMDAVRHYGIMRLGARIWDLRQEGYPIETVLAYHVNRFGVQVRYARYYLKEEKENG